MILTAARTNDRRLRTLACAGAVASLWAISPTAALQAQTQSPMARCAAYGEGFVPVEGGRGCVKIGGRLRVDADVSAPIPMSPGAFGFAQPNEDGVRPASHVRVPGR